MLPSHSSCSLSRMRECIARLPQLVLLLSLSEVQRHQQPEMATRSTRSVTRRQEDAVLPAPSRSAVWKMTVKSLRDHLSRYKLPTTGIRQQLLQRLLDHLSSLDTNADAPSTQAGDNTINQPPDYSSDSGSASSESESSLVSFPDHTLC